MRIRMLAAAVVTAGALMATLTGAASADGTPAPENKTVRVQCEGGGEVTLTTHRLTEAELKELEKNGPALAVPALPALPAEGAGKAGDSRVPGAAHVEVFEHVPAEEAHKVAGSEVPEAAHVEVFEHVPAVGPDGKELPAPREGAIALKGKVGLKGVKVTAAVPAEGAPEIQVRGEAAEGEPFITCAKKE